MTSIEADEAIIGDGIALFDAEGRTAAGKRAVRRSVVPPDIRQLVRVHAMTRPDSAAAAVHCAALVVAWAALSVIGVTIGSLWVWLPIWVAQAFLLHGAYSAMHDAAHGTMFASRRLNRAACLLWSIPLALNAGLWRCWHLEHHRATTTGDDPEPTGELTNVFLYLAAFPVAGLLMFWTFYLQSAQALIGRPPAYANRRTVIRAVRRDAAGLLLFTAGIVAAGVLATHWLVWLWLVPLATYWCAVSLIFGLPEHYGTTKDGTQIDVTRSTRTNRVLSFVIWHSERHAAHHLLPTVNYRHLRLLDDALGDRVTHRASSYHAYHLDMLRTLVRRSR